MARTARINGMYLHVIVRGNGKQIIFEEQEDRSFYLARLKKFQQELGIVILAYCLMDNHVHLLVKDPEKQIALFMKKMGVSYSAYFNAKYDRAGHLFQGRYKSENIEDERYLLAVYRYILNNPVKAGIASADAYRWSSYWDYGRRGTLTDTSMFVGVIGDRTEFARFISEPDDAEYMEDHAACNDAWAVDVLRRTLKVNSGSAIREMERNERDEALRKLLAQGISVRQLERLTGINRGVIQKAKLTK